MTADDPPSDREPLTSPETALDELRTALSKRGNVKLLNLLAAAEGKLVRGAVIAPRRRKHKRVTYEKLSSNGYWSDGSMYCPFQDVPGDSACDYHQYHGCFFDEDEK